MADEELLVTLGVQDKGANKQIGALNRELKGLDKEFKSANKTSKDFEKSTEGLKTKLSYLEKSYNTNKLKLDAYKNKMKETTEAIKKQQENISNMKLKGQDTAKAEEQLQRMKNTLRETGRQATITENEMKNLKNSINETNSSLKSNSIVEYKSKLEILEKSCNSTSETLKSVGSTASNMGGNILKATAPLIAIGTASTKLASDFETSFAKVTTIADENEVSNDKMKKSIMDLSNQTGISCNEIANNVYDAISAGQKTGDAVNFVTNSTKLAKAGFAEAGDSLNLLTTILNSYGMEASEVTNVSDKLITTQNIGKTTVAELSSSMGKVIPTAKAFGVNLDNVATSYAELTAKGIATSEAGTYVASMFNELGKQGTNASKALKDISGKSFQDLINEGKSLGDILAIMDEGAKKNNKSLADMFGSAEAGKAAMIIATDSGKDFNDMLRQMANSAGATQIAFDKMDSTPAERMTKSINKAKNEMVRLGQNILPMMDSVSDSIGKVADWFGKMTEEEQQAIIKTTMFVTAFGGGLKVLGSFTNGLGSLMGVIGKVSKTLGDLSKASKVAKDVEGLATASKIASVGVTGLSSVLLPIAGVLATVGAGIYAYNQYQDGMSKSCVTSREELGLLKSTLLELKGVHVKSREELEKSGLVYKELGDDIGEDFKNKVNESTKAINDFNYNLGIINMDGVLTEEETTGFYTRVDNMCTTAIESIKSKQATSQTEMAKMFTLEDGKIDESEQKVLEYLNKNYNTNIEEVTKLKEDVNKIYANANAEKRALNEDEIKDIQDKMSRIKQIELEALANNEQEQLFAKNEFINRVKQVDAEGAKELLMQQKNTLDEKNAQTLASYDTQIETMKIAKQKAVDEGNQQDADNLQTQIDNKTKERDAIIEKQRETWQGCIDVVNEMNPELKGLINQYTGEILSDADLKAQEGLNYAKQHYDGLGAVTHDGWYKVRNEVTGAMEDCYVTVDKNSGQITGCWNQTRNIVGGYTEEFKNKVKELGEQHEIDRLKIQQAMGQIAQSHLDSKNQVVSANGEVIGSLQQVTTAEGGVKIGILDVNGTPMQIETNADGTITKMGQVKDSVDKIPENKEIHVKTFFEKVGDWFNSIGQNATGTYNYQGGLSTVHERGFELASNNNVRMLGSYNSNPLAYIPNGTGIRTHMQSVSDMKAEIRNQLNSIMLTGGYYNKNSAKAKQLVKNYTNNYSGSEIDYNKLADVMLNVITKGLSNVNFNAYVDVDSNGIANKASKITMDKMNRQSRNKKVVRG